MGWAVDYGPMGLWPLVDDHADIEDWSVAELAHGDLIFCARPGDWVAFLDDIAFERWRHVGALTRERDGRWTVLETVGDTFAKRDLVTFIETYETFGVARLDAPEALVDAATRWMFEKVESGIEHVYAWDDLILSGVIAATQRRLPAHQRGRVRAALASAAVAAKQIPQHKGVASLTCSAFVQIAYETIGCPIRHERWRAAPVWPPQVRTIDGLFDGSPEQFERALADASLLDLLAQYQTIEHQSIERSAAGSRAEPGQVLEMLRVLTAAVIGAWSYHDQDLILSIGTDGRWVTPGDLWTSPTVVRRAVLKKAEALDALAPGS